MEDDGCDNERDRRKESMQKASFTLGFDHINYRTSGGLMGDFDHTPGADTCKDVSGVAEGMRKSSIWWKDSDHLKEKKPSERYDTTHKHHFTEKGFEPNSMGMTIPEIKEFHRKTNYEFGNTKLDYGTTETASFTDFSAHKNLTCEVDIPHLVLATPQCPQVETDEYLSTCAANYQGKQGKQSGPNRDNIKEMRRTHFDLGYDDLDWSDTTHRGAFHRHPFLQMKDNADRVRELRATNWNFGFDGNSKDWKGTHARTFDEGPGSAVYPDGVKRRF